MWLRFYDREPSALQTVDAAVDRALRVASVAEEFVGRMRDEGQISVWRCPRDADENRLIAQHAARRQSRQRLLVLRIPQAVLDRAGVVLSRAPDHTGFDCVAAWHYTLDCGAAGTRHALADALVAARETGALTRDAHLRRMTRAAIQSCVLEEHQRCVREGGAPDTGRAGTWAQGLLRDL